MQPCISQICTLPSDFAADLRAAASAGCTHMEAWLTKLEQGQQAHGLDGLAAIIADSGVQVPAASIQGGLLVSLGDARAAAFDLFRRRLELCEALKVPVLVIAADIAALPGAAGLQQAVESLVQAAQWAAGFGIRLALEFRGDAAFCNNLETAAAIVDQCGEPNLGICLDAFHYHKGPSKAADLARLGPANLFHVHVCDVAGVPRELMTDADRVFPGEGDFELAPIIERLRAIGYAGAVSLEVMNPVLWQLKPEQVLELGWAAVSRLVGEQRP